MSNFPKNFETEIVNYDRGDILKAILLPQENPPSLSEVLIDLISATSAIATPVSQEKTLIGTSGALSASGYDGNHSKLVICTGTVNATAKIEAKVGSTFPYQPLILTNKSTGVTTQVLTSNSLLEADVSGLKQIRLASPSGTSSISYVFK